MKGGVLLERLSQVEALLHVVVVGGGGVDVSNAAVPPLHFTVLLQSLKESALGVKSRPLSGTSGPSGRPQVPERPPSPTPCIWGHGSTSTGTCTSL